MFILNIIPNNLLFDYSYGKDKAYVTSYKQNNKFCNIRYIYQKNDKVEGVIVNIEFTVGFLEISGNISGTIKDVSLKRIKNNKFKYKINIQDICGSDTKLKELSTLNFYFENKIIDERYTNIVYSTQTENPNYAFYFYENPSDQNGAISPVDSDTILNIPYKNNWNGQRYLLSLFDTSTQSYTPLKLTNLKELSYTIDLTNSTFGSSDNCNFNCYFVSSTSTSNPNSSQPPINNTTFVPSSNYYDSAGADGGRYGIEFDIFETNTGNTDNSKINFYQHTGHYNSNLLNNSGTDNTQCISFSSSTDFNNQPIDQGSGSPDTNYRNTFTNTNNLVELKVQFPDPSSTNDATIITLNDKEVWKSTWLIGGTWDQWTTATQPTPPEDNPYPCSVLGTLVPFQNITTKTATPNQNLTLETINDANKAGMYLMIGMNPYYNPPTDSYQANHSGSSSSNGSGGNINIKNFSYTTY